MVKKRKTPIAPAVVEPEELPLPSDPKVIFLGGLFVLAMLAVAYIASEIVLPLIFAVVLNLLLQPALRILVRLRVPRILAALLLILALFGTIVGLGTAISGPARTWAAKLPEGIPRLQERLSFMREPIDTLQQFLHQVEDFGETGQSPPKAPAAARGPTLLTQLFTGTRHFATGLFTTVLFLFFLLVSGNIFLHRLVEILPRFRNKRQAVEISRQIEGDVSAYLITITMNAAIGLAMALVMWLTGVGDPILWGTVAFLLNYVPILGTALGVVIFLLAGLLSIETLWLALLPAGLYAGLHLIEGETVTPMLLAKRFTLNPVLVIISLVFWFWMWGIPGGILSVPMLAITKIICDRVRPLAAFGHFLGG